MLNKRNFLIGSLSTSALALTGCSSTRRLRDRVRDRTGTSKRYDYGVIYGPLPEERFPIPAVNLKRVPKRFLRRQVNYRTSHPVGTVIVDTRSFYLHLVQKNGKAMRYGVGLGRQGFAWSGDGVIQWKKKWPTWTPPAEMIAREPQLAKWSTANGGMPPGLDNALGARALYIFQNGEDTLYRIHGTPQYWTIGKAVSSGCVRMMNHDVIDLYRRVPNGSKLVVL